MSDDSDVLAIESLDEPAELVDTPIVSGSQAAPPMPPASIGSRFASRLVDSVVVGVPVLVLYLAIAGGALEAHEPCDFSQWTSGMCPTTGEKVQLFAGVAGSFVAAWVLYVGVFEGLLGVTVGRLMMGTRLVDSVTGDAIGPGRSVARGLLSFVSLAAGTVGMLWALSEPRGRTWHDLAVGSEVVRSPAAALAESLREQLAQTDHRDIDDALVDSPPGDDGRHDGAPAADLAIDG